MEILTDPWFWSGMGLGLMLGWIIGDYLFFRR
jgi:hypothetical protein